LLETREKRRLYDIIKSFVPQLSVTDSPGMVLNFNLSYCKRCL